MIAALEDSKLIQQDIYLLYIDFKNALKSIDHARLLAIMADLGYPQDGINLIGNIYSNTSTMFYGAYFGKAKPVHIQRGTIQGDTLSPYLFIIFLEPLLRWLERRKLGYKLKTSQYILNSVAYIQSQNIKYRNQHIPILYQNKPYVYLGIQLIPLLKWQTQQTIIMNKLIKQTQFLLNSPTTLKQKLKMVDTVIRPGIAYSFYVVP